MLDATSLDPFRARRGSALHEEEAARDAVGVALHDHRSMSEMGQKHMSNIQIKLDQIPLGKTGVWPKNFAQIGQVDAFPAKTNIYRVAVPWKRHLDRI